MKEYFKQLAKKIHVELTDDKIESFFKYMYLLKEWNEKINLTSIIEEKDIILKHFIDSLTILKYLPEETSIIDVGTGAGFPGIPVKIANPKIKLTLLDSLQKRVNFLTEVCTKINLEDTNVIHGRAEDEGKNVEYREKFDFVTARAVASLDILAEYCLPFVKVGGYFICMKGNNVDEIETSKVAIEKLGGKIEKIDTFKLPEGDIERNLILIKKIKKTPNEFPRKAGLPQKKPIK